MASGRGYLGKISAVVSANTGNYVRGLNESAKRTQAFASSITQDLRRASADDSKSISSILTPIQRMERALQNAASKRLAFRGFDGAIGTVKELQRAIDQLKSSPAEVDFIVRQGVNWFGQDLELKFEARNLLETEYEEFQERGGNKVFFNRYDAGVKFSASVSAKF